MANRALGSGLFAWRHPDLQDQQPAREDPARQHDHACQRQRGKYPTLLDIDQRKAANTGKEEPEDVPGGAEDSGAWMRLPKDALTDRSDGKEDGSRKTAHTHGDRRHRSEGSGRQDREPDEHDAHKAPYRVGSPQTEQRCALDLVWVQRNRDKGQAGKRCAGTDRPDVEVAPRGRGARIHWRRSVLLHAQRAAPRCVLDPPRPPRPSDWGGGSNSTAVLSCPL